MYSLAFGPGSKSEEVGILTRIWQKVFNLTNVSGRDTCLIKTSPMFALVKIGSGAAIRASPTRLLGFYGLKVRFLRLVVAGLSTARDLCARYGRFYAVVKWHRDFIHLEFQGYGLHSHSCLVSVMCEVFAFFLFHSNIIDLSRPRSLRGPEVVILWRVNGFSFISHKSFTQHFGKPLTIGTCSFCLSVQYRTKGN